MKKLLFVGLFTVGLLGASTERSQAGLMNWLNCGGCGCDRCAMHFTVRQYNAFTPFCYGSYNCMGCMPPTPMPWGPPPWMMPPPPPHLAAVNSAFGGCGCQPCCTSGCCDGGCLPSPGAVASVPQPGGVSAPTFSPLPSGMPIIPTPAPSTPPVQPVPMQPMQPGVPSFTPPTPTPLPMMSMWHPAYGGLQRVNYQTGQVPAAYNPYAVPGYWGYVPVMPGYYPVPLPLGAYPGYQPVPANYGPAYWYGQ